MPPQQPHNKRRNSYKGTSNASGSRLTDIHPQDVMSTEMRLRWNIRVLQRHDPAIHSIVDQFTYAVLYRYEDDRWVKRGVEGSMFIYTRTDPPIHGFCILNREGAGNFVQPLRRGDEMEVTDDYIMYRPADVGPQDFDHFIGIWTADVGERKRLNEFMLKMADHVTETDVPYTPVLLYQPLARPEDASLPLITPQTSASNPAVTATSPNKKGRRGGRQGAPTPPVSYQPAPSPSPAQTPEVTVDSLFAKFTIAPPTQSTNEPKAHSDGSIPAPRPSSADTHLRGPALLQSMFDSVIAGGDASSFVGSSSSYSISHGKASAEETVVSLNDGAQPSTSAEPLPTGVMQGNMLKQMLGIPIKVIPSASPVSSPFIPAAMADLLNSAAPGSIHGSALATGTRRPHSVSPGFVPINEEEEQTPPLRHATPPNIKTYNRSSVYQASPSHRNGNGGHRELVAYNFEDSDTLAVSPWMNEPLQPAKPQKIVPPSPSQLPQPRAARDRTGKNRNAGRHGSPQPRRGKQIQPPQDKTDHLVTVEGLLKVVGDGDVFGSDPMISKEELRRELLDLLQRPSGLIDDLYQRYVATARLR